MINQLHILLQMAWVSCEPVGPVDRENMGALLYSPWPGFPSYYFPYLEVPYYMEPIVAVKFVNPASKFFFVRKYLLSLRIYNSPI